MKLANDKRGNGANRLRRVAAYAWAAPCTLVGLCLAAMAYPAGARLRFTDGVFEVALWPGGHPGRLARLLPFTAITFGHAVIAWTWREQDRLRAHEREHVRQYECWHYYRDNWFEVRARAAERFGWPPRWP